MKSQKRRASADNPHRNARSAFAIATGVLIIAMLNLAVLGAVVATAGDATLGARRIEAVRAAYACESGVRVLIGEADAGRSVPTGPVTLGNGERYEIAADQPMPPLAAVVTGRAGSAARSVALNVE